MVLQEMLELLDMKNTALEEFILENDRFLKLAQKKSTSMLEFKRFYKAREIILSKISHIDSMLEKLCVFRGFSFIDIEETKTQIKIKQQEKKKLVTQIVDQDLQIMSLYADSKANT